MFAPSIQVEYISFFEPTEGVWRQQDVKAPTDEKTALSRQGDEEDFMEFCRRSLL